MFKANQIIIQLLVLGPKTKQNIKDVTYLEPVAGVTKAYPMQVPPSAEPRSCTRLRMQISNGKITDQTPTLIAVLVSHAMIPTSSVLTNVRSTTLLEIRLK